MVGIAMLIMIGVGFVILTGQRRPSRTPTTKLDWGFDRNVSELVTYVPMQLLAPSPVSAAGTVPVSGTISFVPGQLEMKDAAAPAVFFKPGEPTTFEEYDGQEHIVEYLKDAVRGLTATEQAIEPQMFLGNAGMGKTLLAKVVANELRLRAAKLGLSQPDFFELFPADIPDVKALDTIFRKVSKQPGNVVFIDEIHDFTEKHTRKLYLVLEEGRYKFEDEPFPVQLPPLTILAATTDYGGMHPALKRRFVKQMMKPASALQLVGYVMRRAFKIVQAAAELIVERTKFSGAPWEALEVYRGAVVAAKGRGAAVVEHQDVQTVFDRQEIDELGLRWIDRAVIKGLFTQPKFKNGRPGTPKEFVCYGASEVNTCTVAQVDKAEYRESIRPRLMARGLLQVRGYYGQCLTEKAEKLYSQLRD